LIERLVENWLDNVNERGYEAAFCQALAAKGYRIVHRSSHGPMEQGKDVIAVSQNGEVCAYQLKTGNLDQRIWRSISGEVNDLVESAILHPNIDPTVPFKPFLVTNGEITDTVRLDIVAKNLAWRNRQREPLQLILKHDLFNWFVELQGRFLPTTPVDFQRFLGLYLAEKRDFLDKRNFCEFLESFLPIDDEIPRAEIRRVFSATAVIANYVLSGFQSVENHLAVAEGWIIVITYLLRIAESFRPYRRLWEPALRLCIAGMEDSLQLLADEALSNPHLIEGDPSVDMPFIAARKTIVLGYLAGFAIYNRLAEKKHPQDFDFFGKVLQGFSPSQLHLWSESASPYIFAMIAFVWLYGREGQACRMAGSVANTICKANSRSQPVGLPDAYFEPQDLMRAMALGENPFGHHQSFVGRSQSIQTFVEFIARRYRKRMLELLWHGISEIDPDEFVPTKAADLCRWRSKKGDSQTRRWPHPQDWNSLLRVAEKRETPDLLLCADFPELVVLFFLVFPHRMTPALSRFIDLRIMDSVNSAGR